MGAIRRSIGNLKRRSKSYAGFLGKMLDPLGPRFKKNLGFVGIFLLVLFLITVVVVSREMPKIEELSSFRPSETTKIYSADGMVLADLHQEENRVMVPLNKISPNLKMAVLAVEDSNFYNHFGIDVRAIFRAITIDVVKRSFSQGASTITQQLARNVFLSKKKNIMRKITEAVLAMQIEKNFSKDEILEMYLNQVYWGHNCYGVEAAALYYFGKTSAELSVGESALLAGLLRGPEYYSPYKDLARAQDRQGVVLKRMVAEKMLTREQAALVALQPVKLAKKKLEKYRAPYFTSHIVEKLITDYGQDKVYHQGLKVYTTLDYKLELIAEEVVSRFVQEGRGGVSTRNKSARANFQEAALIAVDPRTGYIKSLVGGSDFNKNQYNHCLQAQRPAGSSFKPFTYLTALAMGFSPGSVLEDAPVTYNTVAGLYSPLNFTKIYLGPLMLEEALKKSVNNIAVRLINLVGPENVIKTAEQLGIKSKLQPILSLTLGSCEVNMLEMASAYGVLANGGIRAEPILITKITDREDNILFKQQINENSVYDANLISILVGMMQKVVQYGTGTAAILPDRPVAGKTGTTDAHKDAWFIGFIPQMVVAAWVGNDDNIPMNKVTGGSYPAMMWHAFMIRATKDMPVIAFPQPKKMIQVQICKRTGLLPAAGCPGKFIVSGSFQEGYEPRTACWYKHELSRGAVENALPIVPSGWAGRNIYEELGNIYIHDRIEEEPTGSVDDEKPPDWLQEMEKIQ
ncbi:MAG: PBP1A family penicillin-binding protein [Candidatus Margulisiibacteriota bacterium]|jgi:penicillin-binding protein 1A